MRRLLKHPSGVRFRSEGSIEWPDDTFTKKRIRDGSVLVENEKDGSVLVEKEKHVEKQPEAKRHRAAAPHTTTS